MALFSKSRKRDERDTFPPTGPPSGDPASREVEMFDRERGTMRGDDGDALCAFLGKGTRVSGTLTFEGPSRIEGQVEGEVSAQDTLVIGESAVVNARIIGSTIVVQGSVTGDVVAQVRLELRAPSKVIGDVTTPSLVVHDGAILEGRCSMQPGESVAVDDRKAPSLKIDESSQLKTG
jgi:cytoskeletal protein CcmA (bactofilin family)